MWERAGSVVIMPESTVATGVARVWTKQLKSLQAVVSPDAVFAAHMARQQREAFVPPSAAEL